MCVCVTRSSVGGRGEGWLMVIVIWTREKKREKRKEIKKKNTRKRVLFLWRLSSRRIASIAVKMAQ